MKRKVKPTAILDYAYKVMIIIASILLAFSTLSVSAEIVLRYFFNKPQVWVTEISEYIILYIAFLVVAWVLKEDGHVKVDLLLNRLNPRAQAMLNIITSGISAIVCLILTYYGLQVTVQLFQENYFTPTILHIPKFIFTAVIGFGLLLLFLQFLRNISRYWSNIRGEATKKEDHEETLSL